MNLREERKLWRKGFKRVVCLDEAGRGPLSGPVTAAAVAVRQFPISNFQFSKKLKEVKDSKKLSAKKREELYEVLTKHPEIEWGIGRVGNKVIDRINILEATKLAMERAIINLKSKIQNPKGPAKSGRVAGGLESKIDFLILDGNMKLNLDIPQKAIVKADDKVFSCAAASVLAKVFRDRTMKRYHKKFPQYGFDRHKGYPTKYHKKMLKKYGPCKIHRRSFGPVKACIIK